MSNDETGVDFEGGDSFVKKTKAKKADNYLYFLLK